MKAFTKYSYGGPEVLSMEEVEKPTVKDGHLLIRVKANSANPADWHILRGKPFFARFSFGLFKPKYNILGADFSGIVKEVGNNVEPFVIGDRVFGESLQAGAFAEYVCVPSTVCALIPDALNYKDLACTPIAGVTAFQAIVQHGNIQKGQSVFINGSSGGVGHFAVQIAKIYGATVTAVCSSKNVEFVKSLGADKVIAYDKENINDHNETYDLVLDTHGNLRFKDFKRLGKRGVLIGFTTMLHMMKVLLSSVVSKYELIQFTAKPNSKDLKKLASFMDTGKLKVHIEKTFPYKQIPEAVGYIEDMRTRGKVAMVWEEE